MRIEVITTGRTATGAAATIGGLLRSAARDLAAAGVPLPALEARLLVGHALGLSREVLFAHPQRPVEAADAAAVAAIVARRRRGEPLAYIVGEREFWSLPFAVGPDVLIPRPDSEAVVETALSLLGDRTRPLRILDLGTGSGCLLLALLHECRRAAGVGVDRSEAALACAQANAARLGLDDRCGFACADWGSGLTGPFDLVVSNPPYIDADGFAGLDATVRCFEPRAALVGGPDGLGAYRALAPHLPRLLGPGGRAVLEIGLGQRQAVTRLVAAGGLEPVGVGHDLAGHERCLAFRRA